MKEIVLCHDEILIGLKAVEKLTDDHRAHLLNYFHGTGHRLDLLMNFGRHPNLEWEADGFMKVLSCPFVGPSFR